MPAGATTAPSERRPVATLRGPGRSCRSRLLTLVAARFSRRPPWHLEHARARSRGSTSARRFLGSPGGIPCSPRPAAPPLMPRTDAASSETTRTRATSTSPGRPTRPVEQRHSTAQAGTAPRSPSIRDPMVTICVGLLRPRLMLFAPTSLDTLASFELSPRAPTAGDPFSGFSGAGTSTSTTATALSRRPQPGRCDRRALDVLGPRFALTRVDDSRPPCLPPTRVSALPDWDGRAPRTGAVARSPVARVPKLSLANGLYTKPPRRQDDDPWYPTAVDFHAGRTVYKCLAGEGSGSRGQGRRRVRRVGRRRPARGVGRRSPCGRCGGSPLRRRLRRDARSGCER